LVVPERYSTTPQRHLSKLFALGALHFAVVTTSSHGNLFMWASDVVHCYHSLGHGGGNVPVLCLRRPSYIYRMDMYLPNLDAPGFHEIFRLQSKISIPNH
jgi:hypothetical protein